MSKFDIIEHTAMKFAATYYEAARASGLKPRNPKHKTPRLWALHNFEKWIPKALEILIEMLSRTDITPHMKEKIYLAIMERSNDPVVNRVFNYDSPLPKLDLKALLEPQGKKPIIVLDIPKPAKNLKNKLKDGVAHG